ncbi:MAG TPA: hypothetical protein GX720_06525 [Clostridiaceae bacterium]|mgnify:CR=1 FL=1|nr:hypothetical protein [Clostridiaceae bacterium]
MKKDTVYTIYWFFALAPFITALPLFFLMPENAAARYYALAMLEREGTRFEVFLIPAVWLLADVVLHMVYRFLERPYALLPLRLAIPRIATAAIFCAFAITAELLFYQAAMMVF